MEKWPNFFVVGASKTGTTSLYAYLKDTPGVYMSPVKEPRYFNSNIPEPYLSRISDEAKYLKLFQDVKDEKAIGEASPTYLRDPASAELIHSVVPQARIIILLRDPIERAFSHYLMLMSQGIEKKSFRETIQRSLDKRKKGITDYNACLDPGLYANQVRRFLGVFGPNQVKIIIFEEFIQDPKKIVKQVLEFLEIYSEPPNIEKAYNVFSKPRGKISQYMLQSKGIAQLSSRIISSSLKWKLKENILLKKEAKPELSKDDKLLLENFYRNDMKDLETLLKTKLPWEWINNS